MKNKEHTKYYNSQGIQVPSVTNIVKLLDKPQLVGWANYLGFKRIKVEELLRQKAEYGTMVHEMFEDYLMNDVSIDNPGDEFKQLMKKFKYVKDHILNSGYEIVNMELQMHGERVGGTLDLLIRHIETDKYVLLDLKTSKDVYDSMFLQLAGYSMLLEYTQNISVSAVGIILISKDTSDRKFMNMKLRKKNLHNEEIFTKLLDIYYLLETK